MGETVSAVSAVSTVTKNLPQPLFTKEGGYAPPFFKETGILFTTTVPGFEPVAGKRMGRRKVDGIVAGIMACSTHLSLTDVSKKIFRYRISMSYRIDAHKKGLMARRLLLFVQNTKEAAHEKTHSGSFDRCGRICYVDPIVWLL